MFNQQSRAAGAESDPHGHYLDGHLEVIKLLHSDVQALRSMASDRGVRLGRGVRRLPLPAGGVSVARTVPLALTSSACELVGWVLTEVSGAAGVLTLGDGDNSGTDDSVPVAVAAGATSAVRWHDGITFGRGVTITGGGIPGSTGTLVGWLLIR